MRHCNEYQWYDQYPVISLDNAGTVITLVNADTVYPMLFQITLVSIDTVFFNH